MGSAGGNANYANHFSHSHHIIYVMRHQQSAHFFGETSWNNLVSWGATVQCSIYKVGLGSSPSFSHFYHDSEKNLFFNILREKNICISLHHRHHHSQMFSKSCIPHMLFQLPLTTHGRHVCRWWSSRPSLLWCSTFDFPARHKNRNQGSNSMMSHFLNGDKSQLTRTRRALKSF